MRHPRLRARRYLLGTPPDVSAPSGSHSSGGRPLPDTMPTDDVGTASQREVVQLRLPGVVSDTHFPWRALGGWNIARLPSGPAHLTGLAGAQSVGPEWVCERLAAVPVRDSSGL